MSSSSASNTPHASDSAPSATSEPEVLDLERFEDLEHAFARLRPTPPGGATLEVQVGELGRLQIRVDPDGADGLKVAIAAEDPAVAQFLQSRRSEVLEAIASGDAGGDVELDIRQGARDGASGRGTEDEPERQAHRPGHPAHGNPAARRRPAAAPAPTTGSRLVDIVA